MVMLRVICFLFLLVLPVYGGKVVNVYFCGTAMTSQWSDPNVSGFASPELIAELYKNDMADPNLANPCSTHYKLIVDGIGTGSNYSIIDLFGQGFPDTDSIRGWKECLEESKSCLSEAVSSGVLGEGRLTLNLVGFSRGGILCMMLARDLDGKLRYLELDVNILAYDPVPGINPLQWPEGTITALRGADVLPDSVRMYVGVYASDERSYQFEPLVPKLSSGTEKWLVRLRGAHETIAGNMQADGHCISSIPPDYNIGGYLKGEVFENELGSISTISKAIGQELLCSAGWGQNTFTSEGLWYNDRENREEEFRRAVGIMTAYPEEKYEEMQRTVVAVGWSSYNWYYYRCENEYVSEPYALWSDKYGRFCYAGGRRSEAGFKLPALPANHNLVFELEDEVMLIDREEGWNKLRQLAELSMENHKIIDRK